MNKIALTALAAVIVSLGLYRAANAHCEVPCGIYGDQMRFEMMLEDTTTVRKAMDQINALSSADDALSKNQLVRWINNKETHAEKIQHIIAQYFMAQRIKASNPKYVEQLTAAHTVIVTAMKCKQTVDVKNADALQQAITDFHKAYEAK